MRTSLQHTFASVSISAISHHTNAHPSTSQTLEALWQQIMTSALSEWDADFAAALSDEEHAITTSLTLAQAQKRSLLAAAAKATTPAREKTLVSLAWTLTSTVRTDAKKQLGALESAHASRLFAAVMAAAVKHNDALAEAMHEPPKSSLVTCAVMRLVNKTVQERMVGVKDDVARVAAKVDRTSTETKEELRRSLDGGRDAILRAARSSWWQSGM